MTAVCRRCGRLPPAKRYTTASPASIPGIEALRYRSPKLIPDYLVPMPSHLLTTTLSDLLPDSSPPPSSPIISTPPTPLPQGHHLVYFPIQLPPSKLIPDGADPDHSPGGPFQRRLWAGGELFFRRGWAKRLLLDGRAWRCRETIDGVQVKGRDGEEKVFVDVWRRYGLGHEEDGSSEPWDIEERRTLVFMRKHSSPLPPPRLLKSKFSTFLINHSSRRLSNSITDPHQPSHAASLTPTPTHLFHFSALTFNAHAIHFDPVFAQTIDGHRAPLVHGPLSLALMLRVLTARLPPQATVQEMTYRNYAPLYVGEPMTVCLRRLGGDGELEKWDVWVEGPEGGMAVRGSVVVDLHGLDR